jgi:hypothetical protein
VALIAVERRQNGLFMALNTEILTFYLILGTKFSDQFWCPGQPWVISS